MPDDLLSLLQALRQPRATPAGAYGVAGPLQNQIYLSGQGLPGPATTDAGGMNQLPQDQRVPPSQWSSDPVVQLLSALRNGTQAASPETNGVAALAQQQRQPSPTMQLLAQLAQSGGSPQMATGLSPPTPPPARALPGPGYIEGQLTPPHLATYTGVRPFAPGEMIHNPDGSWSSEESMTVQDKSFNNGQPTNIPSLWLRNGRAYVARNEDEAIQLAKQSGLSWPSYPTLNSADAAAGLREDTWQLYGKKNSDLAEPLYTPPKKQGPGM